MSQVEERQDPFEKYKTVPLYEVIRGWLKSEGVEFDETETELELLRLTNLELEIEGSQTTIIPRSTIHLEKVEWETEMVEKPN